MTINNGDALRAQTWEEYVGQTAMKDRLMIHIKSALIGGRMLPHVLLTGSAGYGKTTLAQIIARELGDEFYMLKVSANMTPRVLENILRSWEGGVLFLDEIHTASKAFQHELLTLLEDGYITMRNGRRLEHKAITVIAATTDPQMLLGPLLTRFPIKPHFDPYSDEDMTEILLGMADKLNMDMEDKLAIGLARATGGTPRFAKSFVLAARAIEESGLDVTVESVLSLVEMDEDGLTYEHMSYLEALDELGGIAGLEKLVRLSGLHTATIKELEALLIRRKLITYSSAGREITQAGTRKVRGTGENRGNYRRIA